MIRLIAFKELRSLIAAPSTWLMLGVLQFIFAWFFLARLDAFLQVQSQLSLIANAPGATQTVVAPLFGTLALIMMMLVPVLTMRLLAEERRNQTMALLMAAPVSSRQIVLGKFLGLMLFLLLPIAGCTVMVLALAFGTSLDTGLLLANTAGMLLLTASYAALGLYISALTAQPIVAAISALATLFGLWLIEASATDSNDFWHALTPSGHFQNFNAGLLDSSDLAYYLLFCATFLLLAMRRIHNNRIYG
ncbi:MAG: ABC transporter permease subunit [Sideroxydans sp.]|nr:ABC transporter permease subunit [Sideroxydans sp.]